MKHCGIQQSCVAALEEVKSTVSLTSDKKAALVCPKPRRLDSVRSFLWHFSNHHQQGSDTGAVADTLEDIILTKGGAHQVEASPPFFCGSPPSRVSNPVVMDVKFGQETPPELSSPSGRKGGWARSNFGNKPSVRIEGFDCLPALA